MKRIIKPKYKFYIKYLIFSIVTSAITLYLIASSYEMVFNTPLPLIDTVGYFSSENVLNTVIANKNISNISADQTILAKNHVFEELRIPRSSIRLNLIPSIQKNEKWIYRNNSGQYFFTSKDNKTTNNLVIYLRKNWRSILEPQEITIGDNIFIKRNDGESLMFKINNKKTIGNLDKYLVPETQNLSLIMIIEDPDSSVSYIVQADYISNQQYEKLL